MNILVDILIPIIILNFFILLIFGINWTERRIIKKLKKILELQNGITFSMVREFYSTNFKEITLGWRSVTILENDIFHMGCSFQPPALRTITKTIITINEQNVMTLINYHDSLDGTKDRNYLEYNPDYDKDEINDVIKEAYQHIKREKKRNKNREPNKTLFP